MGEAPTDRPRGRDQRRPVRREPCRHRRSAVAREGRERTPKDMSAGACAPAPRLLGRPDRSRREDAMARILDDLHLSVVLGPVESGRCSGPLRGFPVVRPRRLYRLIRPIAGRQWLRGECLTRWRSAWPRPANTRSTGRNARYPVQSAPSASPRTHSPRPHSALGYCPPAAETLIPMDRRPVMH